MWTKLFWLQTLERAIKAFAASFGALLIGDEALGVLTVNWADRASVAAMAGVISVMFSIASAGAGPVGTPSLVPSPSDAGLKRLATVVRGLVRSVHTNPTPTVVDDRAEKVEEVLDDIGQAKA